MSVTLTVGLATKNWAILTSCALAVASRFGEPPLNGMAGHTGIVTGFGSALEGLADGTGVVVVTVGAEVLLSVADGVAVMVGVATVVRVAVGFADVTATEDDEEETAGGAPSPMTTIRTPGIVLNAAIASSRAEGLSAHTVASRPAKRTLAVVVDGTPRRTLPPADQRL